MINSVLLRANEWTFGQIPIGQSYEIERTFTPADSDAFAHLSGDFSPLHVDAEYARSTEFGDRVVHGMLLASLFSQLVGMWLPGKYALYLGHDLSFRRPVRVGERVKAIAKVVGKNAVTRTITLYSEIRNDRDKVAVSGTAKVKLRDVDAIVASTDELNKSPGAYKHVALVTGGSGGVGSEIARTLAKRGAAVAVNYLRNEAAASSVVSSIRAGGGDATAVQADVRSGDSVREMVDVVTKQFGGVDWVVNCATSELRQTEFMELGWDDFQVHLEHQVKSVMHVAQAAYPHMKANGGGIVVNILSQVTAGSPPIRMADYVSAKYALCGLSKALAAEWAADNIRVNMVSPGLMQTDLTQHYPERLFKLEANRTPLMRITRPDDVAGVVAYLLSDEASFLTGTNLFVTGGQVMV